MVVNIVEINFEFEFDTDLILLSVFVFGFTFEFLGAHTVGVHVETGDPELSDTLFDLLLGRFD